ncbi:MAG: J domain-containing protein [Candidatus Hydrogenedentes bacterium]|nr:J domain-containing protein [Candidatus Hydrogenedentota bacterium]
MFPSLQEFLMFVLIIVVLYFTGLLPIVVQMLKELRTSPTAQNRKNLSDTLGKKYSDLEVCFKLLGVSPSASWEEIEKAYREKAKIHHPDKGGDEDAMKALNDAYEMLRKLYLANKNKNGR